MTSYHVPQGKIALNQFACHGNQPGVSGGRQFLVRQTEFFQQRQRYVLVAASDQYVMAALTQQQNRVAEKVYVRGMTNVY
jgi:hypothetical protein